MQKERGRERRGWRDLSLARAGLADPDGDGVVAGTSSSIELGVEDLEEEEGKEGEE